ncbi:MAG: trypsin-like peptidase domain-containing protein [Thermorudis peleae]|nr:trypsin-like peptidase domain-containing protein [Thermorudis peleae]
MRTRIMSLFVVLLLVFSMVLTACSSRQATATSTNTSPTAATAVTSATTTTPVTSTTPNASSGQSTNTTASTGSQDLSTAVEAVAQKVLPSVVYISVRTVSPTAFGFGQVVQGVGSGVIFDPKGYILTNDHVVGDAQSINVVLSDGRKFQAQLVGRSPQNDIAVIKIDGTNLPVATLGDSDQLKIGQWVVAIGNALGLEGGPTVTVGIVSALNRTLSAQETGGTTMEHLIQTDAAINPGNSGGPLVDLNGNVIGINTAKIQSAEGIGFAIAINQAKQIVQQLLSGTPQGYLGVSVVTVTPALAARYNLPVNQGVLIVDVAQGSPAAQAGLQSGDVVVQADGKNMTSASDLEQAIRSHKPGDKLTLTINRNGQQQTITATLGQAPVIK